MGGRLKILIIAVCFSVFSFAPAWADETLDQKIDAIVGDEWFKGAHWGMLFVDLETGETLIERQADKLFAPASTTKLYSCAAALDALGADHRFKTPLYANGKIDKQGVLHGDLILVASGDPTMGGRTDADGRIAYTNSDHIYAQYNGSAELTKADPLAGLDELARQTAKSGVKRIAGQIVVDDTAFFRTSSSGSGPQRVEPIMVNDNLLDVTVAPTEQGKDAKVEWRPKTASIQVKVDLKTVARGESSRVSVRRSGSSQFYVSGQIAAGAAPIIRTEEVASPRDFARSLLIEALRRADVEVDANFDGRNPRTKIPDGADYEKMKKVAELVSPPFGENIRLVLKVSHNLHASELPILLAMHHGKKSLGEGLRLQHEFLKKAGVAADAISFGGGAGGSSADFTSPRATVSLLRYMAAHRDYKVYHDALPILGVDGTLATAVRRNSPARGKVHAKTGTLTVNNGLRDGYLMTSKALAGYMTTESGKNLAFAMFVNNVLLDEANETQRAGRTLGKICETVYLAN